MPVTKQELEYYKQNLIPENTVPQNPNYQTMRTRPIELMYEPSTARPQDIFFFSIGNKKVVGRKLVSNLSLEGKITGTKCSQITAPMILGLVSRDQVTDGGYLIYFYRFTPAEKLAIFEHLKSHLMTDLYFPYPFLNDKKLEDVSPIDFWTPTPEQVGSLNAGEDHIRRYTNQFLAKFNMTGKKVYDPACSTGQFLGQIKQKYPHSYAIGQDLNQDMVSYTKKHACLDEVHGGDAAESIIGDSSVDFIFFRFLNLEVVTTKQAYEIFSAIANRCRDNGYLILLGHTPILLTAQWFEMLGLRVEQTIAHDAETNSVFQFYVLQKLRPVPNLSFEKFLILNSNSNSHSFVSSKTQFFAKSNTEGRIEDLSTHQPVAKL